jgi:hypothetical protein
VNVLQHASDVSELRLADILLVAMDVDRLRTMRLCDGKAVNSLGAAPRL